MSATLTATTPGITRTPWRRRLVRASAMLLFCCVAALVTTYAHYLLMAAFGGFQARTLWAPWREAWLGGFFWPGAIAGTLWAWGWALARLWNCRWIRAGILITLGTLGLVLILTLASGGLAFPLEFAWIAFASVRCGEWKLLARP